MEFKLDPNVSYALALEGGGARGAYQVGAWRALREAGVRICAVAGTSIGALNGALVALGDYETAEDLWKNITYSRIMDVDDSVMDRLVRGDLRGLPLREAAAQLGELIRTRGIDTGKIRELIREKIDEEAVRASETELFIVTYSVTDQKELELRARDLEPGELHDMLMASAYLPVFRSEKLGGKRYADGGVADVLPLHVLVENGYRNIIAVRIFGTGIERSVRIPRGTEVFTVAPSEDLGGTLEFESERTRRNMRLGYFDAKRLLYGLRGELYYIDAQWDEDRARDFLCRTAMRSAGDTLWTLRAVHERLLPALAKELDREKGGYLDMLTALLEQTAAAQKLNVWQVYTEEEMLSALGGEGACDRLVSELTASLRAPKAPAVIVPGEKKLWTPETPMRVCLLNDSFPPVVDGVANAVLNYARCLTDMGDTVTVGTPEYPGVKDDYPFEVLRYPSVDTSKMVGYRAGNPFDPAAVNALADTAPDLIHTHCPVASAILARILREKTQKPVVFTYHTKFDIDIENAVKSPLMQETAVKLLVNNISACDEVWVVSRGAGENLRSLGYRGEYTVMPNGVDLSRGRASDAAVDALNEKWDLRTDAPVYLFLGRIMWYKGLRIILDAMKKLKDAGRDFRMVFVGDGMDRPEAEAYAKELGLERECRFTGAERDREVIRAWYTRADLFLFPSTFDTNGLVVREAAACSLGSVLIAGSCAAEDIADGDTGILIEENAGSLAAALTAPGADRALFRRIGENASEKIYLSWADAVKNARGRYYDVIQRWNSGEIHRKRARFDSFFDVTGDVVEAWEKARAALDSALEKYF